MAVLSVTSELRKPAKKDTPGARGQSREKPTVIRVLAKRVAFSDILALH